MTHYENADRTLNEHNTQVIWNRIDQGGPVAFKSTQNIAPRSLPQPPHQSENRSFGRPVALHTSRANPTREIA
ncbi:hypothetical protein [Pacificibacter maritimus]|uniref:hypothetical protein n=1 Tax=Pacificibacter maritimus TaxID=762213 RepID=UPI000F50A04F|nr:hypothetical protein [Pacificibacter maritimus]